MKSAFSLLILFCFQQAYAETSWPSRVHECQNEDGFQRRVELRYDSPSAPVPCRVVFYRGDYEDYKIEHVLVEAQHETGKCEAAEEAYLAKMQSWKVNCTLVSGAPSAAETPSKEDVKPPTPVPVVQAAPTPAPTPAPSEKLPRLDWTGIYGGLLAGYQFGRSSDATGDFGYNNDNEKWDYAESGFTGGVEFGYNYAWRSLVIGPEVEVGYLSLSGNGAQPDAPGSDTVGQTSSDFYAALRARVGVDLDHYLLFVAGGGIGINTDAQVVDSCEIAPCGGSTVNAEKKSFQLGYTVGGGVEHLFEMFEKSWSVKLEYLYYNLGSQSFSGTTNLGDTYNWTSQTFGSIVRAGLNFHF